MVHRRGFELRSSRETDSDSRRITSLRSRGHSNGESDCTVLKCEISLLPDRERSGYKIKGIVGEH